MYYIYAKFRTNDKLAPLNLEDGITVAEMRNATAFATAEEAEDKRKMLGAIYKKSEFEIRGE